MPIDSRQDEAAGGKKKAGVTSNQARFSIASSGRTAGKGQLKHEARPAWIHAFEQQGREGAATKLIHVKRRKSPDSAHHARAKKPPR